MVYVGQKFRKAVLTADVYFEAHIIVNKSLRDKTPQRDCEKSAEETMLRNTSISGKVTQTKACKGGWEGAEVRGKLRKGDLIKAKGKECFNEIRLALTKRVKSRSLNL